MQKRPVRYRGAALLFLALSAILLWLLAGYAAAENRELYLTPLPADARGWEIYRVEQGEKVPLPPAEIPASGETVYLSRVLEPAWESEGYTFLELDGAAYQSSIFLDGELVYTAAPGSGEAVGQACFPDEYPVVPGTGESVRVTLPPGWGGRELTIAVRPGEWAGTPTVILTSAAIETENMVSAANRFGMHAAAYAAACLLLVGLLCFGAVQGRRDWALLLLALAALTQALYWLWEFDMRFGASFAPDSPLAALFPALFVLLSQLFLAMQLERRRWCLALTGIGGAAALAAPLLSALPHPAWLQPSLLASGPLVGLAALLAFGIREGLRGSRAFRLFFAGLGLLAGGLVLCCLVSPERRGALAAYAAGVLRQARLGSPEALLNWIGTSLFLLSALLGVDRSVRRAAELRMELELMSAQNRLTLENLRLAQSGSEALARARHDMLGHLYTIQALSREGDQARLEAYLAQLTRETERLPRLRFTGHPVVNAILAQAAGRADRAGVELRCQVKLPDTLPIPDGDLTALLTNLLDNALAGAAGAPPGRRWAELAMHIRGRYLFVEGRNSYAGELDRDEATGLYRSHRGVGHGWGMKSMQDVARRHESDLQAEGRDGVFLVRTALLMPEP